MFFIVKMSFPPPLSHAIQGLIEKYSLQRLQEARYQLTSRYRSQKRHTLIQSEEERLSYLATRMPATFTVGYKILGDLSLQEENIESLLDLGSGPGTMLWVTQEVFPSLKQATLIESDKAFLEISAKLLESNQEKTHIKWINSSLDKETAFQRHDLVTLSYVLGELDPIVQKNVLKASWDATLKNLVIIEPGTPEGFEKIKEARQYLIEQDAFIVAPCTHENKCPMVGKDWCHFSQRFERSLFHRLVKDASLTYEDEKYSFVIASKKPLPRPSSRIVRKPKHGSGHFILDLCTQDGIKRVIVSKKTPELYRLAHHLKWGDKGPF